MVLVFVENHALGADPGHVVETQQLVVPPVFGTDSLSHILEGFAAFPLEHLIQGPLIIQRVSRVRFLEENGFEVRPRVPLGIK